MLLLQFEGKFIKKRSKRTDHRPLFPGNVLKVRLSCVKPSEKISEKKQQKNHGKGKNQDRGRIYTPEYLTTFEKQDILPELSVFYEFGLRIAKILCYNQYSFEEQDKNLDWRVFPDVIQ